MHQLHPFRRVFVIITKQSITAICVAAFLALQSVAGNWPEFRGPTAQGHSDATNVPVNWSAASNVLWKTPLARGWSSPVLVDGKLYVTTAEEAGNNISLRVVALDAQTGKILWNREALHGAPQDAKQVHSKNSLASPTPIVRDGRIYAHFGHMGTAALDLTGNVLWRQTSLKFPPVHGNGGSPLLINDLLVFSCDGAENPYLAALDAKTGTIRWKTPRNTSARNKFSFSTPLSLELGGQSLIISPASGFVAAYAPQDGRELWRVRYGEGYSVVPRPVFGNGLLYVSSGFDRPIIYAIDPKGARGDATASAIKWQQPKGAPNTPSPLLINQEVYIVSDGGIASCLDAKTGEIIWNERLGGNFSASPVTAEGRIYFVNESGMTFVVKADRKYELLAKNDLNERSLASPALDNDTIYIRTDSHLWRIGSRNR